MSNVKRLYRSEQDKMIAGVASGLGEYFEVDPTLVRVAFVVTSVVWGLGVVAYLVMWVLIPTKSDLHQSGSDTLSKNVEEIKDSAKKAGQIVKQKFEEVQSKNRE